METIVPLVVGILGKMLLDKGGEIAKEIGPKAWKIAESIFSSIQKKFAKDKNSAKVFDELKSNPSIAVPQFEKMLSEIFKEDSEFYVKVQLLLENYEAEVKQYQFIIENRGVLNSGQGNIAIGERGVNVSGNVDGNINTGDSK